MLKREALSRRRDKTLRVANPDSRGAQAEVLLLVAQHLAERYPSSFSFESAAGRARVHVEHTNGCVHETHDVAAACDRCPLELAGLLLQEDLLLVRSGEVGQGHRVDAGFVAFSFGRVDERVGMSLDEIHRGVDRYEADLAKPVNRFFHGITKGSPTWRTNFGLSWSPTLVPGPERYPFRDAYAPSHMDSAADWMLRRIEDVGVGHCAHLKVEYQTIRRLSAPGYALFTVRSFVEPLHTLRAVPEAARALALNVRHCARGDFKRYLGLEDARVRAALLAYLDQIGEEGT